MDHHAHMEMESVYFSKTLEQHYCVHIHVCVSQLWSLVIVAPLHWNCACGIQLKDMNLFPMISGASVWTGEQMSAAFRGARSKQFAACTWVSSASKPMSNWIHFHSTHCGVQLYMNCNWVICTMGWNCVKSTLSILRHVSFSWALERVSKQANEQMSAAKRASEASSAGQANEWPVWAYELTEEQEAQYSLRPSFSFYPLCTMTWCKLPRGLRFTTLLINIYSVLQFIYIEFAWTN